MIAAIVAIGQINLAVSLWASYTAWHIDHLLCGSSEDFEAIIQTGLLVDVNKSRAMRIFNFLLCADLSAVAKLSSTEEGYSCVQVLPLDYDPDIIADYWGRRPVAVAGRCMQLLGIAGGFLGGLAMDALQGRLETNQVCTDPKVFVWICGFFKQ